MKYTLRTFDKTLRLFLTFFLAVQFTGVAVGLVYLEYTTNYSPENAVSRYKGTEPAEDFGIQEEYAKPVSEMLITTHNHILGFSFILFATGIIFYFNTIITGFWKKFLLVEPLISVVLSFGSLWTVRFIHEDFVYLTVISAVLLYSSYFIMTAVSIYDMAKK